MRSIRPFLPSNWIVIWTCGILAASCQPQEGPDDGGTIPLQGFGQLSGECGVLDDEEWNSSGPFLFRNRADFDSLIFDESLLSSGGREIVQDGNLGGNSLYSEAISFDLLYRCELAALLKTEGEIVYENDQGKKTDILLSIDDKKIGVSVTRAIHYPPGSPFSPAEAQALLDKKLSDIPQSASNAAPGDAWARSILHVFAYDDQHAETLSAVYEQLGAAVQLNILVFITITDGNDAFVYGID
jgi:hypothetical protein